MAELEPDWFEKIFDLQDQFTWILDPQGMVIRLNQAARKLVGPTADILVGKPLWSIAWPGLSRSSRRILKIAIHQSISGRPSRYELDYHHRGRSAMILSFSCNPVTLDGDRFQWIIAEGQDITAYKRTSEALVHSEARFKTIFEQAQIGILIKGINGKLLDSNPAFQTMLGYTAREILKLSYLDITHPQDKRSSQRLIRELVNGKRNSYMIEKRYLHKDGHPIWVRVTASLVLESDHQAQFIIALVENIQTSKEIENELSELQQRLMNGREMERLRIAQELHDGPLQELIDVTYQLHDLDAMITDESLHEPVNNLQSTVQQLARSIRVICGELRPPTLVPFGLGKTIQSHVEQFREAHPEITVKVDLADDGQALSEPIRIVLFRIYQTALNNIVRHAQASRVTIQFGLTEEKAILKIRDNGNGFELPNRWIHLARQGHLGLVGARERAKEVGGDLKVTSRPGKGTVLQAVVPLCEEFPEYSRQGEKP